MGGESFETEIDAQAYNVSYTIKKKYCIREKPTLLTAGDRRTNVN